MKIKTFNIRYPESEWQRVQKAAERNNETITALIERGIEREVQDSENKKDGE